MCDKDNPYFSVVVPLFNKEAFILRAIDSIRSQSFTNFEVLVVDDGSTDNGPALVEEFCDKRLRLIRQKNSGVSSARNLGVLNTSAPYIAFLDADDIWLPNFLENINQLIVKFPDAGIYATSFYFSNGLKRREVRYYGLDSQSKYQLINNYFESVYKGELLVCSSAVCIPRFIFNSGGIWFPPSENHGEDQYVWARIALQHIVAYSTIPSAIYEINLNTGTHINIKKIAEPHSIILSLRLYRSYARNETFRYFLDKYISKHIIGFVKINCSQDRKLWAIRLALKHSLSIFDIVKLTPYFLLPAFFIKKIKKLFRSRLV